MLILKEQSMKLNCGKSPGRVCNKVLMAIQKKMMISIISQEIKDNGFIHKHMNSSASIFDQIIKNLTFKLANSILKLPNPIFKKQKS